MNMYTFPITKEMLLQSYNDHFRWVHVNNKSGNLYAFNFNSDDDKDGHKFIEYVYKLIYEEWSRLPVCIYIVFDMIRNKNRLG